MKKLLACCLALVIIWHATPVCADVVKPALIEISVFKSGHIEIELRASIEALLTGINSQYGRTQDSPFGQAYDQLRVLPPQQLAQALEPFKADLLKQVWLKIGSTTLALAFDSVSIPPAGYTKVPRISTINLTATMTAKAPTLQWYYPARFSDSAVRVRQVDLENEQWHWSQWQWIRDDQPSERFSLTEIVAGKTSLQVAWSYMIIGFLHIVPRGTDHILFILGIFLLSTRLRPLLWQVTMFTVAHTLTLGLSAAGIIELPARLVEPLIALSIAYVGIENILTRELKPHRLILVFCFGLLHGLGFASVLAEFGMPTNDFVTALIGFNVGVELGQLAVIFTAFALVGIWFSRRPGYRRWVVIPGSLVITVIGLSWTVDRVMG